MQQATTQDIWQEVCGLLGLAGDGGLTAVHLQEIETEAENVLELLTVLRTDSYRSDANHAQETAAELTIALEHLQDHIQSLLPQLQKRLDIEP
jgi:hypothetical protein